MKPVLAILAVVAMAIGPVVPSAAAERVCRLDRSLEEISGLTASLRHPDVLWAIEDSGGGPRVVAIDASTCAIRAELTVRGSRARDYEAIASGRLADGTPVLWIGDIGDNRSTWATVELLRIREPERLRDRRVRAARFAFTYDDRPHDAEALLAHGTRVWVVTKQLANGGLYELPDPLDPDGVSIARRVRTETGLVTDGNVAPDGSRYVLRDYFDAELFTGLPPGESAGRVDLPPQRQGEAIAFSADGSALLIASEGDRRLLRVDLRAPAADPVSSTSAPTPAPTDEPQAATPSAAAADALPWPWPWLAGAAALLLACGGAWSARRRVRARRT